MKKTWVLLLIQVAVMLVASHAAWCEEVRVYPAPAGETLSTRYTVSVGGQAVPVYLAKVASADRVRRMKAMDDKKNSAMYYELASFAYFDMQGPVQVSVTCPEAVRSAKLLPSACGITPVVSGQRVTFTLAEPKHLTLEINGTWVDALHLFANPPETDAPRAGDPDVIYFGPGIHEVDGVMVDSGKTVYVAGGAVVRGKLGPGRRGRAVFNLIGDNITLRGRGIIDGSLCPTHTKNLVAVRGRDIRLEGVILRDSSIWTVPIRQSERVTIHNLKLLGYRANSDGIDICSSRDVEVTGCFIRTLDDLVVIKTLVAEEGEARNITVKDCVLWNEVAHALSIGAELRANVSKVRFMDCDVIHDMGREWTLRVYHCDAARISDVSFENIRIEETRKLISLWINKAIWSKDNERGHIADITFKDIRASGQQPLIELKGYDAGHEVERVHFEGISVNGQPLKAEDVKRNEFVREVNVRP